MALLPIGNPIFSGVGIRISIPRPLSPDSVSRKPLGNSEACRTLVPAPQLPRRSVCNVDFSVLDGVCSLILDATTLGKPGASLYILLLTFLAVTGQLAMPEFGQTSPSWMLDVSDLSMVKSSCRRTYEGFTITEEYFLSADQF